MKLDDARVQRFLDGKQIVILATVQPDGAPLAMAMWFVHDADAITMLSQGGPKVRNIRRDPRVSVVAELGESGGGIRGVAVQGRASFLDDSAERRALVERFHKKYPGLRDLWRGLVMPPDRVMFRIVPTHVRHWGL
jgi:PPOX class probable F420-dependent enzyme